MLMRMADADDDGDMDIVALQIKEGDRVIEWFENDDATFANSHPILTAATHVDSILAGDINHDGLMDVAVESQACQRLYHAKTRPCRFTMSRPLNRAS